MFSFSPFFLFSISSGSCDGLTHIVLLVLALLVDAGCNVGDAELEELVDKPGTTNGT